MAEKIITKQREKRRKKRRGRKEEREEQRKEESLGPAKKQRERLGAITEDRQNPDA